MKSLNGDGLKIFEKDIVPKENDKTRWLAKENDDFFENMGKRGAKKKNTDKNFLFNDVSNPILLILNHKNPKLVNLLSIYASQLLKGNYSNNYSDLVDIKETPLKKDKSKKRSKSPNKDVFKLNELISSISTTAESSFETVVSDEEYDDILPKKSVNSSDEDDDNDSTNEKEENSDSEEGVSCIEIRTTKDKLLWYNEETGAVYEPEGDDGGEEIGILKEISEKYHTIKMNDKSYTVLKDINVKKHGTIYYCALTNKLFNKKLKYIGNRKKSKDKPNEYQLDFFNEL
jgi:hypothetical protein